MIGSRMTGIGLGRAAAGQRRINQAEPGLASPAGGPPARWTAGSPAWALPPFPGLAA